MTRGPSRHGTSALLLSILRLLNISIHSIMLSDVHTVFMLSTFLFNTARGAPDLRDVDEDVRSKAGMRR